MNSQFTKIVRILLALILIAFGLNKLLPTPFIPLPALPEKAMDFMTSLGETGYVLKLVGVMEIIIGILLILKKWVPFALILLVPISFNILLFHLFLDASGIAGAIVVAVLNGILIYKHWKAYKPLFN
ncbi:DoxX family membrane protein [Flavobacterium pallidum]|uniref:DoxX protein n=1 Tax=Flavobacterium pallidum TaxID=2172098 RepID=A0A2S1SFF9_9FLAO|nr:DoxX family membrane protein [Flavobacterium pallidum]AWI25146.1 DoxX protein [Flavobacterium pallidum]